MARVVCAGMICSSGLALAAPAKAPALIVINAIEPGQWELRELGAGKSPRLICVANPDTLIQLRHAGATCARYVIDNQPQTMTVNYSCDGTGNGRTTITLQTPRQLRLQTQGIAQGAPFDVDYTARRVGDCVIASH
jgi:hypothetical protein